MKNVLLKELSESKIMILRISLIKMTLILKASAILRREINPAGKSRAFINDTPVTISLMKDLGDRLIDIHSQHQTLMLNDNLSSLI